VEYSLELCTAGGSGALASIFRMGLGSINRSSSTQMAQTFVNDRIRRVRAPLRPRPRGWTRSA
jgi:hypothetical protein